MTIPATQPLTTLLLNLTRKQVVEKYGGYICQKCGAPYSKKKKRKTKGNTNLNQCAHCNRSEAAKQRITRSKHHDS